MKINFFEEFPTEENFRKLKLVNFETTVFVAAHSLVEFKELEQKVEKVSPMVEVAYWPILEKSYWISPFSENEEIKRLMVDFEKNKQRKGLKVLLDLEFPMMNKKLNLDESFVFEQE